MRSGSGVFGHWFYSCFSSHPLGLSILPAFSSFQPRPALWAIKYGLLSSLCLISSYCVVELRPPCVHGSWFVSIVRRLSVQFILESVYRLHLFITLLWSHRPVDNPPFISIYPFDPFVSLRLSCSLYGLSWDLCIYETSPCDFLKWLFA